MLGFLGFGAMVLPGRAEPVCAPADRTICADLLRRAEAGNWRSRPMGELMTRIGRSFIGTAYKAKALEVVGVERLVVDLQGLDCTTLVESTLALARCIKAGDPTFAGFSRQLQQVRYRDGRIDGYPSRLHYFSDWIFDHDRRGLVQDVTLAIGGEAVTTPITFMSTHRQAYRQLESAAFLQEIRAIEHQISLRPRNHVPLAKLSAVERDLQSGDIIAITTDVPGLDVSHVGLAVDQTDGRIHFLHAPMAGKRVQITEVPLVEALKPQARQTGIMVVRPLPPR